MLAAANTGAARTPGQTLHNPLISDPIPGLARGLLHYAGQQLEYSGNFLIMDARTIRLVRSSWATAVARPALASRFYAHLFAADPALRRLFRADIDVQAQKLAQMLDGVVTRLHDLDAFVPQLREMGARHEGYGVRDAHYQTVGDVLIDTLAEVLGAEFSAETEIAWATAVSLIAQVMMSGAHAARAATVSLRPSTGGHAAA